MTRMKLWRKILFGVLGLVALVGLGLVGWIELRWNHRYSDIKGPADLHTSTDPKVIEHGKYLVRGPAHCSNCHQDSFESFDRADKGEELPLQGGVEFCLGPLGCMYPKNLTPCKETGIGRYDDATFFRMMRTSVKPDDTMSMTVLMPFHRMADDDLVAVASYLRAQTPIRHEIPPVAYTFLGKAVRTFAPLFQPVIADAPKVAPPEAPTRERGEYLSRYVANCVGCHTKGDLATGRFIGPEFGGGFEFEPPPAGVMGSDGKTWYRSPNLTIDETGIMSRYPSKEEWIKRFRQGRVLHGSPMHWGPFSRMSDADLEAIWVFLKSLAPVPFEVGTTAFIKQG
jgi:mono/diheme cytochrome c family protein